MKLVLFLIATLAACGNSASDNEAVGQVKRVIKQTPIACPNYVEIDVSLGVLRNGAGSVSKEDVAFAVDPADTSTVAMLKHAAETGDIVKFTYDIKRVSWCWEDHRLVKATLDAPEVQP